MDTSAVLNDVLREAGGHPDDVAGTLATLRASMESQVEAIVEARSAGDEVWPVVSYSDVEAGTVRASVREAVKRTGCLVVRSTFERSEAEAWDEELGDYVERNGLAALQAEYNDVAASEISIFGLYWSRPQIVARQHDRMQTVRLFLNSFWNNIDDKYFDPTTDIGYPDRIRRRAPGQPARGLLPHIDSVATTGWKVGENQGAFASVLAGDVDGYDAWDPAYRTTAGVDPAAPSDVFRTFQGWTALSEMRPGDGVLHAIPIVSAAAYLLMQGVAGELGIGPDGTSGVEAVPAPRRMRADDLLLQALVPIPAIEPGDTVWWHGDVIHSVGDAANDKTWSNLMYIGATPRCARNDEYSASMFERFERGASPIDFPDEDFEVDFENRATVDDLSSIGRRQFGIE